ncbi:glycine cleavage system protein H [bacterium]|nr:glycine cleavage system protein H [bacterium]
MPADDLVFPMGKYEARMPVDRQYTRSHFWLSPLATGYRVGFTAYAVRLLQDVYFLDWTIDAQTAVKEKEQIGEIESSKAVSAMYAPAEGLIREFNPALYNDPSLINADNYGSGWLYELETESPLLSAQEYYAHLEATWETTQRLLKSQYNE